LALTIEERYEPVRILINTGRERGYLLSNEVNDILPAEIHSSEEIDELLSTFERYGIDIYEDISAANAARSALDVNEPIGTETKDEIAVGVEEIELDLTPGLLEKISDPVRMYLREMGTVPLLKREGEVAIAKRIDRGRLLVLKTTTRSPIVIKELIAIAHDTRRHPKVAVDASAQVPQNSARECW
jgi:RNA polymerase primary sigma factor